MSTKWTTEQKKAISISQCNTLVSAAAGSGKTAVLVQRVIDMITDKSNPVYINELLIATFTNAAAAEMKERIHVALQKKIEEEPDNEFVRQQLVLLGQAQISTIHSFCTNLIRENFHLLGIRHDFDIADESKLALMRNASMDEVLENAYIKGDEDFLKTVDAFGGKKDDSNLSDIIMSIYRFAESLSNPVKWLEDCINNLENTDYINIFREIIDNRFKEFEATSQEYEKALEVIENDIGLQGYYNVFYNEYKILKRISQLDFDKEFVEYLTNFKAERLPAKKNCADPESTEYVKKVREIGKGQIDDFAELYGYTEDDIAEEIKIMLPYVRTVCGLVKDFIDLFSAKKLAENVLDFNDLEHYAIKLLEENEDLRNYLRGYYKEILVDEYQDTNGVQAYLFELLSNGSNLFMVGDVKQSIYGFRNSNPKFFIDKYNQFSFDYEKYGTKINLAKNFRSGNNLINSVNNYFEKLMIKELGGVTYNKDHALEYGNESIKNLDNPVERYAINIKPADNKDIDGSIGIDKVQVEASFVANRIYELVEKEKPEIYDKTIDGFRSITYKDIVVLMRKTKGIASVYAQVFGDRGIPVYTAESGGYFDCIEIATVMSFLKIIENPLQDIPMLAVMRSPIFGFDDNLIAELRTENKKCHFYTLLKKSGNLKAVAFINELELYREFSKFNDVGSVVRKIVFDTGYYQFVGGLSNGEVRMMNLKLLCERANNFSQKDFKGISKFISFVNAMIENESEYSSPKLISESENVVTIMSIHKSKGLEFPVVFLCETGKQINKRDLSERYMFDEELGLVMNIVDVQRRLRYTPYVKYALKEKKLDELISEEIRLLYVALTRAKNKIIITGTHSGYNIPAGDLMNFSYNIKTKNRYFDWLFTNVKGLSDPVVYNVSQVMDMDTQLGIMQENTENYVDYSDFYDDISKILGYKYPYLNSKLVPSKKSISEVIEKSDVINLSKISGRTDKISAAQRGTLIHFVLQNIDLKNVGSIDAVALQIEKMIHNGVFESEYAEFIDVEAIYGFFTSDIGKRMLASDKIYREFRFCVDISARELGYEAEESVLIQGIIDCCFVEDDKFVIIDYKTGSLHEKYKRQLELYKRCLEISTGKPVKETHIYPLI